MASFVLFPVLLLTVHGLDVMPDSSVCNFENIFGAGPPPYYVNYRLGEGQDIHIDGSLDDVAWKDVPFTEPNPDICGTTDFCSAKGNCAKGCAPPRFSTRQKMRWDDEFLYVGAELEEPQIWANNTQHNSVIFSDNDYEVFISPDGSNHYYKEFEVNARAAWWDLCLNKPYSDGGYENSSRVFNTSGWDDPELVTATKIHGCELNQPASGPCKGWSVEIKFPLAAISLNNTNSLPPKHGSYWRIDFSRVEYKVHEQDGVFVKDGTPCDNWLWAPLGVVDVHQPERWGYLQFSTAPVNTTAVAKDPDFALRSVAMQLYYAQHAFAGKHNGSFTNIVNELADYLPLGSEVLSCTMAPVIQLGKPGEFLVEVQSLSGLQRDVGRIASVTQDRYLLVRDASNAQLWL